MKYLHTMIRISNLEESLSFFTEGLGLKEVSRKEYPQGKFTLIFLAAPGDTSLDKPPMIELTYNWDDPANGSGYSFGRNFGHIAFGVENIYDFCDHLINKGIQILRPPKDGRMAFVKSPDNISIELLQIGEALPLSEPWQSMMNQGSW